MRLRAFPFVAFVALVTVCTPHAQTPTAASAPSIQRDGTRGPVEIVRDQWGIPHVFAGTDAGAFYGLGYATAEDRAFQMTYTLRMIQGRLSEVVGEVRHLSRNETSLDNDRKMRTFGFYRAAVETAAKLDPETRALLEAYCDGVNAYFAEQASGLHPLFERLGLKPEPWTPADCLASWWHFGQFFATDGTRELIVRRNRDGGGGAGQGPGRAGRVAAHAARRRARRGPAVRRVCGMGRSGHALRARSGRRPGRFRRRGGSAIQPRLGRRREANHHRVVRARERSADARPEPVAALRVPHRRSAPSTREASAWPGVPCCSSASRPAWRGASRRSAPTRRTCSCWTPTRRVPTSTGSTAHGAR